jgi:3-hydroxybutyryl-CoA dehydrogenase
LKWAEEIGYSTLLNTLNQLFEEYGEDRYRPNPLLKKMVKENNSIFTFK